MIATDLTQQAQAAAAEIAAMEWECSECTHDPCHHLGISCLCDTCNGSGTVPVAAWARRECDTYWAGQKFKCTHKPFSICQSTGYLPLSILELADQFGQQEGFREWLLEQWAEGMDEHGSFEPITKQIIDNLCIPERTVLWGLQWLEEQQA